MSGTRPAEPAAARLKFRNDSRCSHCTFMLRTQETTMPKQSTTPGLITAAQAAQRLLEEATLEAFRSKGQQGLLPVKGSRRQLFRQQDVEAFIRARQAA